MGQLVFIAPYTFIHTMALLALLASAAPYTFAHMEALHPVLGPGAPCCIHCLKVVLCFDFSVRCGCGHTCGLPAALKTGHPCLTKPKPC